MSHSTHSRHSVSHLQRPITSSKGGYLRCPFDIDGGFAELAARHVQAGAKTNASAASAAAEDDKDGMETGDGTRPWTRAGVGARQLSAKERRAQQEQAEKVYGTGLMTATSTSGEVAANTPQEHLFAVDMREQMALQKVVTRAARMERKRQRDGDGKHGGRAEGRETAPYNEGLAVGERHGDDATRPRKAFAFAKRRVEDEEDTSLMASKGASSAATKSEPASELKSADESARRSSCALSSAPRVNVPHKHCAVEVSASATSVNGKEENDAASSSPSASTAGSGGASPLPRPSSAPPAPSRPLNRMQQLEEKRRAALFGMKKKNR